MPLQALDQPRLLIARPWDRMALILVVTKVRAILQLLLQIVRKLSLEILPQARSAETVSALP